MSTTSTTTALSTGWTRARRSAWAHRGGLVGTALVLALAGALLAVAGVLAESGLRTSGDVAAGSGLLLVLASSFAGTVVLVVVPVVIATVALALRGRRRELALLRTVGATGSQLRRQVGAEVLVVGAVAAPVGAAVGLVLARALTPLLRDAGVVAPGGTLTIGALPVVAATALVLPVAGAAAWVAARESVRVAPGQAVRESTVEAGPVGVVRRTAALVVGLLGLAAAFSPVLVPGTVGGASAATSAFLLVGAAALAGPLLLERAFADSARWAGSVGPAGRLALANLRGFSRRLTVVVVPLALVLTAGVAQTTVDRTVTEAARVQLDDGLTADLVASTPGPEQAAAAALLPGVTGTTLLTSAPARVLSDPDLAGVADALAWEPTTVRSVAPGETGLLVDPDVRDGSLADLAGADTVAVSSDATFGTGVRLGDTVSLRWADGSTTTPTVVAVYGRGLGFGDYLVGPRGLDAHAADVGDRSLLVDTAPGAATDVRARLAGLGLEAVAPATYVESATATGAAERRLSAVLLLALLGFVLLAAANTLVMVTVRRRAELALYARTGATRRQLVRMVLVEATLTGALAWVIGTLAVVPTVLGVGWGMLGPVVPPVDLSAYLALSAVVVLLPVVTTVPVAARLVRQPGGLS